MKAMISTRYSYDSDGDRTDQQGRLVIAGPEIETLGLSDSELREFTRHLGRRQTDNEAVEIVEIYTTNQMEEALDAALALFDKGFKKNMAMIEKDWKAEQDYLDRKAKSRAKAEAKSQKNSSTKIEQEIQKLRKQLGQG